MQVFLVCSMSSPSQVLGRVKEHYDANFLSVGDNEVLLIATDGQTTQQVSENIGLGEENLSTGIVLRVGSYWGRHNPDVWEWIAVKMEANGK